MRALLLGDTHGNQRRCVQAIAAARDTGCSAVVQVGDFGYWPHNTSGLWFLRNVEKFAAEAELPFYWLGGNHENWAMIAKYLEHATDPAALGVDALARTPDVPGRGKGGQPSPRAPGYLRYLPRGCRWEWGGVRFLALGGAWSIDWHLREQGRSWWPTEMIDDADVERAVAGGDVDVLLCHDAPGDYLVPGMHAFMKMNPGAGVGGNRTQENRDRLTAVVEATHPRLVVHGHYHEMYDRDAVWALGTPEKWHNRVVGLGADVSGDLRQQAVVLTVGPDIESGIMPLP